MLIKWDELNKNQFEAYTSHAFVAINFASTEQHSCHLPTGTDAIIGKAVLEAASRQSKANVIMLPQVCFGNSPHHRFAKGYITIPQHILVEYVKAICKCVYENEFKKIFLVNSHGGNQAFLSMAVNEVGMEYEGKLDVIALRYWDLAKQKINELRRSPQGGMGHAGEFETSVMMYLAPELVDKNSIKECDPMPADPWGVRDLVGGKQYLSYSSFNNINIDGHIGQPHFATQENGERFFHAVVDSLTSFFDYFADAE